MPTLDEAVARFLTTHPFQAAKFYNFLLEVRARRELRSLLPDDAVQAHEQVSAALERVLTSENWRHRVTAVVGLTNTPHNAAMDFDINDPAMHTTHLTGLVYLGMLHIATCEVQQLEWTDLLERLRSFPLIRALFPTVTEETLSRCLVTLHTEGSIVYERIIAIHLSEAPDLG